jgi:hypothetical protein
MTTRRPWSGQRRLPGQSGTSLHDLFGTLLLCAWRRPPHPRRAPIKQTVKPGPLIGRLLAINAFDSPGMLVGTRRAFGDVKQPAVLAFEMNRLNHPPPRPSAPSGQGVPPTRGIHRRRDGFLGLARSPRLRGAVIYSACIGLHQPYNRTRTYGLSSLSFGYATV